MTTLRSAHEIRNLDQQINYYQSKAAARDPPSYAATRVPVRQTHHINHVASSTNRTPVRQPHNLNSLEGQIKYYQSKPRSPRHIVVARPVHHTARAITDVEEQTRYYQSKHRHGNYANQNRATNFVAHNQGNVNPRAPHATTSSSTRTNTTTASATAAGYKKDSNATNLELRARVVETILQDKVVYKIKDDDEDTKPKACPRFMDDMDSSNKSINDEEKECCCICIETFEEGDIVVSSLCDHIFHRNCLVEWGKTRSDCPECRQDMWDQNTFKILEHEMAQSMAH